jgi:predicted membrane-bound spermidine synthase
LRRKTNLFRNRKRNTLKSSWARAFSLSERATSVLVVAALEGVQLTPLLPRDRAGLQEIYLIERDPKYLGLISKTKTLRSAMSAKKIKIILLIWLEFRVE